MMEDFRKKIQRLKQKIRILLKENDDLKKQINQKEIIVQELNQEITRIKSINQKVSSKEPIDNLAANEIPWKRLESAISQVSSTGMGHWNQIVKQMNEMKTEFQYLRKKINQSQVPPRKLMKKIPNEQIRLGIFVDVQNIFYGARKFNAKLDFDLLLEKTASKRRVIRAFAYVVQTSDVDQSGFMTMLQHKSFEVKSKNLRLRSDGSAKANWDIEMTIDMLSLSDKFDVIILVSGDGDFVPLVNILKTLGPFIEVYSFPHNTSRDLMEAADKYCAIDDSFLILNEYEPLDFSKGKSQFERNNT